MYNREGKYKGKLCGPLKSAKNPDAYTKDELVALAVKRLKIDEKKAKSMTKSTICKSLNAGKIVERTTPVKKRTKLEKKATPPVKTKKKVIITPVEKSPVIPKAKIRVTSKKPCIEQSKLSLKEHQIRVVNHIRKNRGLIVCHDVGSGKTLTAVTAAQCFLEDTDRKGKIIVVTPVSLQDNFKKEMKAYGVGKNDMKRYEFYTLQKFATEYNKKVCGGNKKQPIMLIIDEAHNLRTDITRAKAAARTRALTSKSNKSPVVRADVAVRCAKTADKVLLLTATSVYNNPRDIANLVAMVKGVDAIPKKAFEKMLNNKEDFEKFFACMISFYDVPKNTEDYPTVTESYVEIPMTPSYYKEYRKVEHLNSHLFLEKNPWKFLTGVRQASNALEECIKCKWVLDRVTKGKKMVIYSAFKTYGVERIQEMFEKKGISYVEITGEIKKSERTEAVKKYNKGKVDVLFITKAGGEGLDLKETREVIIFESSWNRATDSQVIGRAVRYQSHSNLPKSERHVDVFHVLMVKPDIKERTDGNYPSADSMLKVLTEKKERENSTFIKKLIPLSIEQRKC